MKKLLIVLVFLLSAFQTISAQTERLNDYSFVVVPKRFDFQFEEDQYELNSLLKFLFNKYGFHAYFENELPDTSRCDGLWADVERTPGFIWTELVIMLKDCDGVIMNKSVVGKSKLKDYGKAYHEALRMSFESIAALGVSQKEIRLFVDAEDEKSKSTQEASVNTPEDEIIGKFNLPNATYTNYSSDGASYLLKKTKEGYTFYKEYSDAEEGLSYIGKLFIVEGTLFFEDADKTRYLAEFDEEANLTLSRDGIKKSYLRN